MGEIIKAVIFDMDGVISDTQTIHSELEELLLKEHGIEINAQDLANNYAGIPDRECAEMIFKEYKKEVDLDKFVEEKWAKIMEFGRGRIRPIDGALDLIGRLKENDFRLAIASSSTSDFIDLVLSELGIKDKFETITNGQEVKSGKPAPDIFLLAAQKSAVLPQDCWVIEDGKNGVAAAKRAGMKCVWLTSQKKNDCSADIMVKSLKELQIKDFR